MTEVRPLSKAPNPQLLPGRRSVSCPLLQVCVHLDGLEHISLLVILCIIVYVTNKAHLSLIITDWTRFQREKGYAHVQADR